jgi:hypothetical protein
VATPTHPSDSTTPRRWPGAAVTRDAWVALAITAIWVVVLLDALLGPDIVVSNAGGFTRLPSAVIVVCFAYLATRVVAKWGTSRAEDKPSPSGRVPSLDR